MPSSTSQQPAVRGKRLSPVEEERHLIHFVPPEDRDQLERVVVSVRPTPRDRREAELANHRCAPPRLSALDVREVDLDRGHGGDLERVDPGRADRVHPAGQPGEGVVRAGLAAVGMAAPVTAMRTVRVGDAAPR